MRNILSESLSNERYASQGEGQLHESQGEGQVYESQG